MSEVRLPGPLVFTPATPASDDDDLTGGMTYTDLVATMATIDLPAAVIAAIGARYYLTYSGGQIRTHLWLDDPTQPCCADTASTVEHRVSQEHVGSVHADLIAAAARQSWPGVLPPSRAQLEVVVGNLLEDLADRATTIVDDLVTTPLTDPYYRLPFWALDVPDSRIDVYERLGLTWPQALTFEAYGPPATPEAVAALEADVLAARSSTGLRRGHLTLLR